MLVLLSPSKTLRYIPLQTDAVTQPFFLKKTKQLVQELAAYSKKDIQTLMHVSERIAEKTVNDHRAIHFPFTKKNAMPAISLFQGHVFQHIHVASYSPSDLAFAQKTLRILSGLYGILRPLDLMQPYRLEMRYRVKEWKDLLTAYIADAGQPVINLASKEYASAIDFDAVNVPVYTVVFKEKKGDTYSIIRLYAKYARGRMAHWIIKNNITDPERIKDFSEDGYHYTPALSNTHEFVFTRATT
ncbi:MAG: hypothetical protein COU33_00375 [Candidatus Magasanikbacteria bacterium CG10_big_fil_rev_8_21_14_0_10_43_6]|uniref:UPF0246 protein COU33_00375 n=1 Tax=Candidatus Magasanikbacteria bacterium CG10_big_fil_rev_8_21_14_0_10_43_6 TaxID=1974650 RepID=A0A2M6W2J8_9BACT|nr:MAG: hypothetical protein COU33_00375 [Candidatus Magasanikbacteria bacterium CG10_big_fil_rev_8_21_14_0_10_43_6]